MSNRHFSYTPTDGVGGSFEVYYGNELKDAKIFFDSLKVKVQSPIYIVDKNLPKSFIDKAESIMGYKANNLVRVDPASKTIDRITGIWHQMVNTVPDIAFVIGGGTICDLAGFACANYQRGIPRILFPTTLLSMVDASIGGKSGIDFAGVKNSIGAIHYPIATISYLPFLASLGKEEYISGFAEIIKAAILYDKTFFERIYKYSKSISNFDSDESLNIFYTSSRIKATVCEETNKKKVSLLYGHSIGHAIERYEERHLKHGDCVAVGMTIEGALACVLGIWNKDEWKKQQEVIARFGLPSKMPEHIRLADLAKKMLLYKKLVGRDSYLFSLPQAIGQVNNCATTYLTAVKRSDLVPLLEKTLQWIEVNRRY